MVGIIPNYIHAVATLIDTKGMFTKESLKAYKTLEAYNYYNGYVQIVYRYTVI